MNKTIKKEEAITILRNKFPEKRVRFCDEYSTGYLVEMVPAGEEHSDKKFFDSVWFVAKDGSVVTVFMPGMVPENEIKRKEDPSDALKKMLNSVKAKSFIKHFASE